MAPTATPLPRSEAQLRSSAAPCPAPTSAGRALELRHSYVLDEMTWRGFRNVYNDEANDEQLAKLLQYVRAELARLDEVLALSLRGTMNSRPAWALALCASGRGSQRRRRAHRARWFALVSCQVDSTEALDGVTPWLLDEESKSGRMS